MPNKNIRSVAGKPLWHWSALAAFDAVAVDNVLVTTDYPENELRSYFDGDGLEIVSRPAELAGDTASLDEALIHAIDFTGITDDSIIVVLQPTVPVRRPGLIDECLRAFSAFPAARSLLTATRLHFVWHGNSGRLINGPRRNRQELDSSQLHYHEDGSVFIVRAGDLRQHRSRVVQPVTLYETEPTVDIDTEADLALAEFLLKQSSYSNI